MPTLVSPGVSVSLTDESAYASPGTGTIPLVIVATAQDKVDPTGTEIDGIAKYTKKAMANAVVPVTSQREITQFFGDAIFSSAEGAETSEYGLLAAYSYLGQGSQAYVVRADIDLNELEHSMEAPTGPVAANTVWLDTDASAFGVHEFDGAVWTAQSVTVEVKSNATAAEVAGSANYVPTTVVVDGDYLVAALSNPAYGLTLQYFKGVGGSWSRIVTNYQPHYAAPATTTAGATWIKTTSPGNGVDLALYVADASGTFNAVNVETVEYGGPTTYVKQDGSSVTAQALSNGNYHLDTDTHITIDKVVGGGLTSVVGTIAAQDSEPTGAPTAGQLWFNSSRTGIDVLVRSATGWARVADSGIQYDTVEPTSNAVGGQLVAGNIWIDTSAHERHRPALYQYNGASWVRHDNSDQSTQQGVIFADFTYSPRSTQASGVITPIADAPEYALYPQGMLAVNMAQSSNTVRRYDATVGAWVNAAPNHADGSGAFGRLAQRKVVATAMQAAVAGNEDLRDPMRNFTLLTAPNFPELTDELVTLNSDRGETGFIIIDTPMRKTPTEAVAWAQAVGASENGEDGLVTKNTYSAAYYPAGRSTTASGETVTVPPSHMALYQYAYNDNIAYPWFAPAGLTRGSVQNASAVGYITGEEEFKAVALSQGQRDAMYSFKLNPIATYPTEGVVLWGQKSLHPATSALDRVNVARLVAYLRERFDEIARPFLFEPNDKPTRDRVKLVFEGFLADIMAKRGVYDFAVVCDESNNTPARIDRNELYVDIAIEPTKAAEFIYIPIRVVNTGVL